MMKISEKFKSKIVESLMGTADSKYISPGIVIDDIERIEQIMYDANYERCSDCDCWTESGEIASNETEYGVAICDQCVTEPMNEENM